MLMDVDFAAVLL